MEELPSKEGDATNSCRMVDVSQIFRSFAAITKYLKPIGTILLPWCRVPPIAIESRQWKYFLKKLAVGHKGTFSILIPRQLI
jgi:hypothetical protein